MDDLANPTSSPQAETAPSSPAPEVQNNAPVPSQVGTTEKATDVPNPDMLTNLTAENAPKSETTQADTIPEIYELVSKNGQPAEDAGDFQDIFKKAGLTSKQAQAMYDAYNLKSNDITEQFKQAVAQKTESDMRTVRSDPELGGVNFNNTRMYIGKAMDQFGSPALREKLKNAGFGNDPDFVRFVARIGKAFSNDEFIGGHGKVNTENDQMARVKAMYSNSPELWHN